MPRGKKSKGKVRKEGVKGEESKEQEISHLQKVFYSTDGLWKGHAAIEKLANEAGVSKQEAANFLKKQALWQIFLPPPKHVPRPHWTVDEPNAVHQADLLFLPQDSFRGKVWKYALVVVDVASRFKDAEPLTSKASEEVARTFKKIYNRVLKWPETIVVDPGSEFRGEVAKMFAEVGTKVQTSEPGNHRAQAFVERANRTLGEKIFSSQYAEDLASEKGDGRSKKWVKRLPDVMAALNNSVTRLTGRRPLAAFFEERVALKKFSFNRPVGFKEPRVEIWSLVRFLLRPGEEEGGDRKRATNPIWSWKIFEIERMRIIANQPILYFLEGGPRRGFVREELQIVPEDTEAPPKAFFD